MSLFIGERAAAKGEEGLKAQEREETADGSGSGGGGRNDPVHSGWIQTSV